VVQFGYPTGEGGPASQDASLMPDVIFWVRRSLADLGQTSGHGPSEPAIWMLYRWRNPAAD
jgi:hypothetical protein